MSVTWQVKTESLVGAAGDIASVISAGESVSGGSDCQTGDSGCSERAGSHSTDGNDGWKVALEDGQRLVQKLRSAAQAISETEDATKKGFDK